MIRRWRVLALAMAAGGAARGSTWREAPETFAGAATAGAFLERAAGARAAALGGAYTALDDEPSAVFGNPAGLGRVTGGSALAEFNAVAAGGGGGNGAVAFPWKGGMVGLATVLVTYPTYQQLDAAGAAGATVSPLDAALGLGWGYHRRFWVLEGGGWSGFGVEYVRDAAGGGSVAFNAGTIVAVNEAVALGVSVQHLGGAIRGFKLPQVVRGGVTWRPRASFTLTADAGYRLSDRLPLAGAGVELAPVRALAIRAGYEWRAAPSAAAGLQGLTAGVRLRAGRIGLDYAFLPYGDLAVSHRVALVIGSAPNASARMSASGK